MPELPEVESIRRALTGPLTGQKLLKGRVLLARQWRGVDGKVFFAKSKGLSVAGLGRRGKLLWLDFGQLRLFFHLGMTGRLLVGPRGTYAKTPYLRTLMEFEDVDLAFTDTRTLGRIHGFGAGEPSLPSPLDALGPDALDLPRGFWQGLPGWKRPVKAVLLDQGVLAGVGNIYADEALFAARIHPETAWCRLQVPDRVALGKEVDRVLRTSVKNRGTTFSDYRLPDGAKGSNLGRLKIYGRTGEPCAACGQPVVRLVVAARGTHVCPHCQKVGGPR